MPQTVYCRKCGKETVEGPRWENDLQGHAAWTRYPDNTTPVCQVCRIPVTPCNPFMCEGNELQVIHVRLAEVEETTLVQEQEARSAAASILGKARSDRKAASSRINGKLGGRPPGGGRKKNDLDGQDDLSWMETLD